MCGGGEGGRMGDAKCALPRAHFEQPNALRRARWWRTRVRSIRFAKLECLVAGMIIAALREPTDRPTMGDDVEEPQKLDDETSLLN